MLNCNIYCIFCQLAELCKYTCSIAKVLVYCKFCLGPRILPDGCEGPGPGQEVDSQVRHGMQGTKSIYKYTKYYVLWLGEGSSNIVTNWKIIP